MPPLSSRCKHKVFVRKLLRRPWSWPPCDESCIGSEWSCHAFGGHSAACCHLQSTCCPCDRGHRLASLEERHRPPPCLTKPLRSGFYLAHFNDKSPPCSAACAAGTCWRPSVKGIVYVLGDPELITIPPFSMHYCSSR